MMTQEHCHYIVSLLRTEGSVEKVIDRVKDTYSRNLLAGSAVALDAGCFLAIYDKFHNPRQFPHGGPFVDMQAFHRAWDEYAAKD